MTMPTAMVYPATTDCPMCGDSITIELHKREGGRVIDTTGPVPMEGVIARFDINNTALYQHLRTAHWVAI